MSKQSAVDFHGIKDISGFQSKVLYLLTEIHDSVKHAGKVTVEQCRGLWIQHLSTLDQLKEFEQFLEEGDNLEQETPQCDETKFSTIQPSVDMTGIRNETWQ